MTNFFHRIFGVADKNINITSETTENRKPEPLIRISGEPDRKFELLKTGTFRFVAVDVETANSNNHSICQVGLAMVSDTGEIHTVSFLVNPEEGFDDFNVRLHGINDNAVCHAPIFEVMLRSLRPFLERHTLIQHSGFDKRAFDAACKTKGIPSLRTKWLDSVIIARTAWPELKGNGGHGLASLKAFLDLDFDHHDAEEDARAAAEVVLLAESQSGEKFPELAKTAKQRNQNFPASVAVEGNQSGPLYGHVACFTGQLSLSRTEAAKIAAGAGITVKAGMSKKVTLTVVGEQDLATLVGHTKSSKHRRAEELINEGYKIRIIGELEFLELVGKLPS
ncbi:exonuclease domain-containing protein [uncultured Ruegeria sp.]|uniref:exonuclease domain-containing protein n=1 Tax=uncultured Ruegeria sp. TaxID=259304 RepID=UPI00260748A5|nr:exonuclease domain-containing protein [uncultured Ruegeria sp.]